MEKLAEKSLMKTAGFWGVFVLLLAAAAAFGYFFFSWLLTAPA